ncbi:hypothetical protein H112_03475 [Trichophyton rubrum D6]|uniref:Uncharacterized protein n=2 Tax=Trichophyton TaxID=5550 RepID=A0A022W659_TRIRU|nr:hypothetical protein H102_03474 [Trichophyton rubrum CBS 100081]EZF53606.1 hypothetical protein H103_03484 [Trichophyton rubrum CBS 288.86]EZF64274.1 hypothetical protein H104_03469 [Trichophyton rubrum CBS 289.86]EZF74812.1 hypothetical protein H105_03496 [Trichophyton soudanense CBS 452.61]EZF85569.1 hypothetical protein H110_03480 [Trichophyton rubrum MR1448]EZF96296.1 hypothetical protein H113_03495 [Trichophyton rubrum MR1459]EZG07156.1 hypothetical protein H106_03285 [Trichophyton ru
MKKGKENRASVTENKHEAGDSLSPGRTARQLNAKAEWKGPFSVAHITSAGLTFDFVAPWLAG